jgi:signal transduction histidine kinase
MRVALGLDLACIVFAALAAFVAVRALARQRNAEQAYEEMLETRGAELEVFARRVAHDLLSPLSALSFTLATVKRNADRGLPIAEPLQRSNACLKRSQQLVDGVLNFARSAALPSPSERASLRDAVEGAVEEVRADGGNAEVEIVVPALDRNTGVVVACAPGILASVISNLLRNAVKYIGDGPGAEKRVTIRALPTSDHVRVEIEDTGPGIPSELAPHVFEPYVRGPNNTQPGLGLGLATVRRFVEAHGGQVGVDPAPRRGSIFWFELPRLPPSSGAGGEASRGERSRLVTVLPGGDAARRGAGS